MPRTGGAPLAGMLALLLPAAAARAASFPAELRFHSLRTARASVHYHDPLEPTARRVAALTEQILAGHEARYGVPVGRVHVVVADTDDAPNGFASPFPYPIVQIRAAAPDGSDDFGNHDGWLRLVLTHELAHVVHLSAARGVPGLARRLLGRAPLLFPNTLTPTWLVEGLATFEETEGSAFGRGRNPDSRMVLRMAALAGGFPGVDRAVLGLDAWPAGQAPYLFGEAFLRHLGEGKGDGLLPELARVHSSKPLPFLDDFTARAVTGASFHHRWEEWRAAAGGAFALEAESRRSLGLTRSRRLTSAGVRQGGPRFSPDGRWIAYTSRTLERYREIRLVGAAGEGDRRLALRNGGGGLAWTPDGATLVYDEPESFRLFRNVSDLRALDVASGRVRKLTSGLRARDPDVSPDGRSAVFVRRLGDRSELFAIGLDGSGLRRLTESAPDTEWSGPRFSPDGGRVAASRLLPGGRLDLVLLDLASLELAPLMDDRAKDVEPAWLPDGSGLVFRSDRDGASNLYRLTLTDGRLWRVSNVLGGAFAPDVAPDGRRVAFANYTARGYDIHLMELDGRSPAAEPFLDPYPPSRPEPPASDAPVSPYRPFPAALPRFWMPYAGRAAGEWRLGAFTAGADPLLRHAYVLEARYGTATRRPGLRAAYRYDRLRPSLLLALEDTTEPASAAELRSREIGLVGSLPLRRSLRASQEFSLGWRRRRENEPFAGGDTLDLGGLEAAYSLEGDRRYPYSVSPVEGGRLRLAVLREAPFFGSDVSLAKLSGDARGYRRLGGGALALRVAGGATLGRPAFTRSFALGGFPEDSLGDVVRTSLAVLRGYPERAFSGRSFLSLNVEARLPLAHPQRGWRTLPLFLRHLHATAFLDAGNAWSGPLRLGDLKASVGAALGADWNVAHALPLTFTAGVARGFATSGVTQVYLRSGLSF